MPSPSQVLFDPRGARNWLIKTPPSTPVVALQAGWPETPIFSVIKPLEKDSINAVSFPGLKTAFSPHERQDAVALTRSI